MEYRFGPRSEKHKRKNLIWSMLYFIGGLLIIASTALFCSYTVASFRIVNIDEGFADHKIVYTSSVDNNLVFIIFFIMLIISFILLDARKKFSTFKEIKKHKGLLPVYFALGIFSIFLMIFGFSFSFLYLYYTGSLLLSLYYGMIHGGSSLGLGLGLFALIHAIDLHIFSNKN